MSETFKQIGQVAQGLNSVTNAGVGLYQAFKPKSDPVGRIGLGSSGLGSLAAATGGGGGSTNLAANLKESNYQSGGGGGGAGSFGGSPQSGQLPMVDRNHQALLLKMLQSFQG